MKPDLNAQTEPVKSLEGATKMQAPRRATFLKAFEEERKHWRWSGMKPGEEALVLAFCACVHLRMQGTSMDEAMNPTSETARDVKK